MPRLTGYDQPTIAVITSLYCDKLAVDALIDDKTTFVKYKTEGTFNKVQHVFLVGVGGSVPDYDDGSKHVRLGDIVVSVPTGIGKYQYLQCQKLEYLHHTDEYRFNVKEWSCPDDSLQNLVNKYKKIAESSVEPERPWDIFLEEESERLKVEESNFHRPFIKTDRLFYTNPDSTVVEVEHPPADKHYFEGRTNVRFGPIASGKHVAKDGKLRKIFARTYGVRAYDAEADAVLESLKGNRNESFLIIRGIVDYTDGSRKEWQPYSSMVAAAYMKTLIMDL